jgi:hypothetical protein
MRYYASILIALLALTNVAFCAVGDSGVSDGFTSVQPGQGYDEGTAGSAASLSTGYMVTGYQSPGYSSQTGDLSGSALAYQAFNQQTFASNSQQASQGIDYQPVQQSAAGYESSNYVTNSAMNAPQIAEPYQDHFSPDDLNIIQPNAENFHPDGSLNFAPASIPSGINVEAYNPGQGQGYWYYPGSSTSKNRFYAQTSAGLMTTAGCSYGGYLPLWSDINSPGNFYVYEWYPGQTTPSVRWWGWTWQGFKKGWFTGDVAGWHILCYNCRDWSNYVYVYVWPGSGSPYASTGPSAIGQPSLPSGAPTPPDMSSENLALPDYNQYQPNAACAAQGAGQIIEAQSPNMPHTNAFYPAGSPYPVQDAYSAQVSTPAQSGYSTCPTCTDNTAATVSLGAYMPASGPAYSGQNFQAVYPTPVAYRCNEYYIQTCSGKLGTVAGARYGEWLPLWSKIGRPGVYWSFEWTQCGSPQVYCYPDVKSFGYKGMGWYQTWFRGDSPGWHILSYYNSDWSNYVYVYVWPV